MISLDDIKIKYQIKINPRSRNIRLSIQLSGVLIISVPKRITFEEIETALFRHKRWILNHLKQCQHHKLPFKFEDGEKLPLTDQTYLLSIELSPSKYAYWETKNSTLKIQIPTMTSEWIYICLESWYREMAKQFLERRITFWADEMDVKYSRFFVKNQKTVWGSCSQKRNLNFNWRIMLLSSREADYLVIHELAHLIQMNHSPRFWKVVEKYCPNYRFLKKQIKRKSYLLKFPEF